jgi:hypothetical protein
MSMHEPSGIGQAYGAVRPKTVVIDALPAPAKLYARALSGMIKRGRPSQLPALRLVRPAALLEPAAIERYARVCGFIPEHGVPLTYPHLLAFPAASADADRSGVSMARARARASRQSRAAAPTARV